MDAAFLSWLPDGQGLILVTREYADLNRPAVETIARMDLSGNITPIRKGSQPTVLDATRGILFEDDDGLWKTCDFHGENVHVLAEGMKHYAFPSPSHDGRQILWMRFDPAQSPKPVVLDVGSTEGPPVTTAPGLWMYPTWR